MWAWRGVPGPKRVLMPVAIVVALVGLVLWDASGRPAILDPLFLGALAVGAVGGWSLVRAIRDGRAKRRRGVEDRR